MKKPILILALILTVSPSLALAASGHDHADKSAVPAAPDAAWLAQAKAEYPLTTCVISEEALGGEMGDAIDFVYQQAGQPDRLVRFCCKGCRKDFNKEPAKYLKMIDDAAAKAKKN